MTAVWLVMSALAGICFAAWDARASKPSRDYRDDQHCPAREWVVRSLPPEKQLRMG